MRAKSLVVSQPAVPSPISKALYKETPPDPGRLVAAVSRYPYTPKVAIADIVDNAIPAGADAILVVLPNGESDSKIVVADNGSGIEEAILDETLKAGSRTEHLYGNRSLSRFGIGLKSAGLALGHRVVVLTRPTDGVLRRRSIDEHVIELENKWLQDVRDPDPAEAAFFDSILSMLPGQGQRQTGTVITIEGLNVRSREFSRPNDVARALGETYAKFLTSGRLQIRMNDLDVAPVDPLHRENPDTVVLFKREEIKLSTGASLFFSAVALPHPNQLPQELARKYRFTQSNQGIYLYRNGRLIRSAETLGLFGRDFHLNAFRAEVEYGSDADRDIEVDVAKSEISTTPEVTSKLQDPVDICRKTANTLWREKDVLTRADIEGLFDETNHLIDSRLNLLAETAAKRKALAKSGTRPKNGGSRRAAVTHSDSVAYLVPKEDLPDGVLYRPIYDGEIGAVVVEVNLRHKFSKAVFSVSPGEGRGSLPRKATTAVQQLIYTLGDGEFAYSGDTGNCDLFEQFRKYVSMNLGALLE